MFKTKEKCDTQPKLVAALETIDEVKILNKDKFLGINQPEFPEISEFCRNLEIEVNGIKYVIEWYINYSTIKSEFMLACFDTVVLQRPTWPLEVGSKLNLQLMLNDKLSVII